MSQFLAALSRSSFNGNLPRSMGMCSLSESSPTLQQGILNFDSHKSRNEHSVQLRPYSNAWGQNFCSPAPYLFSSSHLDTVYSGAIVENYHLGGYYQSLVQPANTLLLSNTAAEWDAASGQLRARFTLALPGGPAAEAQPYPMIWAGEIEPHLYGLWPNKFFRPEFQRPYARRD